MTELLKLYERAVAYCIPLIFKVYQKMSGMLYEMELDGKVQEPAIQQRTI